MVSPVEPICPEQQTMGAVADAAGDIVGNAMGMTLKPVLEASIEPILILLADKVGEMTAENMIKDYSTLCSGLAGVPNLVGEVKKAVSDIMMGFRAELIEYCEDVVRCDIGKGFEHVMMDLIKASWYGIFEAEETVWSLMPGFAGSCLRTARQMHEEMGSCCDFLPGFPSVGDKVIDHVLELMKGSLKAELKLRNIPSELSELLPWNSCDYLIHQPLDTLETKLPAPKSGKKHIPNLHFNDNPMISDAADMYGSNSSY
jgi:hypothetical protein